MGCQTASSHFYNLFSIFLKDFTLIEKLFYLYTNFDTSFYFQLKVYSLYNNKIHTSFALFFLNFFTLVNMIFK